MADQNLLEQRDDILRQIQQQDSQLENVLKADIVPQLNAAIDSEEQHHSNSRDGKREVEVRVMQADNLDNPHNKDNTLAITLFTPTRSGAWISQALRTALKEAGFSQFGNIDHGDQGVKRKRLDYASTTFSVLPEPAEGMDYGEYGHQISANLKEALQEQLAQKSPNLPQESPEEPLTTVSGVASPLGISQYKS